MLTVLVKMMLAQAQECVFERISLPGIQNEFFTLVRMAQEAAKVGCKAKGWLVIDGGTNQDLANTKRPLQNSDCQQNICSIEMDHTLD